MTFETALEILGGLIAAGCLLLAWMAAETRMLKLEQVQLTTPAGMPSPIRIACLSDLHMRYLCISPQRIRRILEAQKPDLLLIAGDILDSRGHIRQAEDWLRSLALRVPAFVCPGNHDNRLFNRMPETRAAFAESLGRIGAELLCNEARLIEVNGGKLLLSVLDEPGRGRPDIRGVSLQRDRVLASLEERVPHLLMTHNPELLLSLPERFADASVSGHFHGGQIWMPFNLEFRLFRTETLGRRGIIRGLHDINGIRAYLSRGLGSTLVPFRFLARPEITILELRSVRDGGGPA